MATVLTLFIFLFGLAVGSFINVVIVRLATGKTVVRGSSQCPRCGHRLGPGELIPIVSFAIQRGRCRHCHGSISWQYPIVELSTGCAFLLLFLQFGLSFELLFGAVATAFLIVIFVFDLQHKLILDVVSLPAIAVSALGVFVLRQSLFEAALGGIIGAGFFTLQYVLSRGRWIGGGDIRLGAFLGILLGWRGLLFALLLAYVSGAVVGSALLLSGRKQWGSQVAFGPFLAAAGFVSLLVGPAIADWYVTHVFGVW